MHSDSDFAPVAYLKVKSACLEPKTPFLGIRTPVSAPDLFNLSDLEVYNSIPSDLLPSPESKSSLGQTSHKIHDLKSSPRFKKVGPWVAVGNIQADIRNSDALSIEDETRECFGYLTSESRIMY